MQGLVDSLWQPTFAAQYETDARPHQVPFPATGSFGLLLNSRVKPSARGLARATEHGEEQQSYGKPDSDIPE